MAGELRIIRSDHSGTEIVSSIPMPSPTEDQIAALNSEKTSA